MNSVLLTQTIKQKALEIGFDRIGITSPELPAAPIETFHSWLAQGYEGSMEYMSHDPERRSDPRRILPDAKSVICLLINYYQGPAPSLPTGHGRISRYAWGRDYHKVIEKRLQELCAYIHELGGAATAVRPYVDTGPVLERAFARQAGIGFVGKNAMLITPGLGSWTFLSVIITTLDLEPDRPISISCGTCTRCIEACPTNAIVEPHKIDSNKCISYLTIELKEDQSVSEELRSRMGDWIFGCDICQEVCPFNRKAPKTDEEVFQPERGAGMIYGLNDLLAMRTEEAFREKFSGTPLKRARREGLLRSAAIAAGNLRARQMQPALRAAARGDPSPVVREHSEWALAQLEQEQTNDPPLYSKETPVRVR